MKEDRYTTLFYANSTALQLTRLPQRTWSNSTNLFTVTRLEDRFSELCEWLYLVHHGAKITWRQRRR